MPNVFLVASAQVDSIVYPAGCVLSVERLRATMLISLTLGVYDNHTVKQFGGALIHYDHERLRRRRHISGRAGVATCMPDDCFASPAELLTYLSGAVTVDGVAYAAGALVSLDRPTAQDILANGLGTIRHRDVGFVIGSGAAVIDHAVRIGAGQGANASVQAAGGSGTPSNALTFNGDALTYANDPLTYGAAA